MAAISQSSGYPGTTRDLATRGRYAYGEDVSEGNHLGEYLRARREALHPEDVGLPPTTRRRVPGLRREETAMLAGISTEYYLRLERGRDTRPSEQVVDALAVALQLDEESRRYLHALAHPADNRRRSARKPEKASPGLAGLIGPWITPALIQDRLHNTLAANPMAIALSPAFTPGNNSMRSLFLDEAMRDFYIDWEMTAIKVIAGLRAITGPDVDDPGLSAFVGELSVRSEDFRRLWARQEVRTKGSGTSRMRHPVVGELELDYEKLAVQGTDGQLLIIYHARAGSISEERLSLLNAISVPPAPADTRAIPIA
jgi:transcriptional regulator with XRE-family HTH domain